MGFGSATGAAASATISEVAARLRDSTVAAALEQIDELEAAPGRDAAAG